MSEDKENLPPSKKTSPNLNELEQIVQRHPQMIGHYVWFFSSQTKCAKGLIIYNSQACSVQVQDVASKKVYISFAQWITALGKTKFFKGKRSAMATIFVESSSTGMSLGRLLK